MARVDPRPFGLAIVTCKGEAVSVGDCSVPFSIQIVSKVLMLTLALLRLGVALWQRVGREPSGSPFNSIVRAGLFLTNDGVDPIAGQRVVDAQAVRRLASYAPGGGSFSIALTARRKNFICSSTVRQVWQMTK